MACLAPMPNDLLSILVLSMGRDYCAVLTEYQQPGGPERLRQLAGEYVHSIRNQTQQGDAILRAAGTATSS